jgi:hypothetical protein
MKGELCHVPFVNLIVDELIHAAADGERAGTRQRGLHLNSVVNKSVRSKGWKYDQGTKMRVMELVWNQDKWDDEIAQGKVPSGTPMPRPLCSMEFEPAENGVPIIKMDDMKYRRFIVDDGSHRTNAMHDMIKENHHLAQEICERGILLLDADPVQDQNKTLFSSIMANVEQGELDRDFLADKIGQIKAVCIFLVSITAQIIPHNQHAHTPQLHIIYMECPDGAASAEKAKDKKGTNATHFAAWIGVPNASKLQVW